MRCIQTDRVLFVTQIRWIIRHTIIANTNFRQSYNFTCYVSIVDSSFNVTLNINWRAAKILNLETSHTWHNSVGAHKTPEIYILFDKLLDSIFSKCFIMNNNTMPLGWPWQVGCTQYSLVPHTSRSNVKDC